MPRARIVDADKRDKAKISNDESAILFPATATPVFKPSGKKSPIHRKVVTRKNVKCRDEIENPPDHHAIAFARASCDVSKNLISSAVCGLLKK
jgi:hypothetical protein